MVLAIQVTIPTMAVDSFASFKGDSEATGTAFPATRMTLQITRINLPATVHGKFCQLQRLFWKDLNYLQMCELQKKLNFYAPTGPSRMCNFGHKWSKKLFLSQSHFNPVSLVIKYTSPANLSEKFEKIL
jgi:hypothetical protein